MPPRGGAADLSDDEIRGRYESEAPNRKSVTCEP